eukprot:TRINITY_DN4105_c2_g1_i1.p1 TRINITY_DN4105_c2_g1~~TRINITY_DN4105_c2_g1_i1.p1  ORF type:complete len:531 (+),score=123.59 TRINITY_DN4105_c2_g1_i1:120-1595(+)
MAAIAGGGFRGAGPSKDRSCNCEQLRAKLARARAELRDAREAAAAAANASWQRSAGSRSPASQDQSGGGSPVVPATPKAMADVASQLLEFPPRPLPTEIEVHVSSPRSSVDLGFSSKSPTNSLSFGAGHLLPPLPISSVEASTQTAEPEPIVDAHQPKPVDAAVQACLEPERLILDASVQTLEPETIVAPMPEVVSLAVQTLTPSLRDASSQAEDMRESREADSQTESVAAIELATQAGPGLFETSSSASQTTPPPESVDGCVQAEIELPMPISEEPPAMSESSTQTLAKPSKSAVVQTAKVDTWTVSTQCEEIKKAVVHKGVQAEDKAAALRTVEFENKLKDVEASLKSSAAEAAKLRFEQRSVEEEIQRTREDREAWQQMAQSTALGQMNITILCPRAECTVNGDKVDMDSWNPAKLRKEFEEKVLPRFTKVFVDDNQNNEPHARPEAVQRTMDEFASVFRERLSAMLSAPNAGSAVTAAASRGAAKAA